MDAYKMTNPLSKCCNAAVTVMGSEGMKYLMCKNCGLPTSVGTYIDAQSKEDHIADAPQVGTDVQQAGMDAPQRLETLREYKEAQEDITELKEMLGEMVSDNELFQRIGNALVPWYKSKLEQAKLDTLEEVRREAATIIGHESVNSGYRLEVVKWFAEGVSRMVDELKSKYLTANHEQRL